MNLYQCQEKAKDVSYNNSEFYAMFPSNLVRCEWLDAYMGLLKIDADGLRDSFVTVKQIDEKYPDLICSEPIKKEQNNG